MMGLFVVRHWSQVLLSLVLVSCTGTGHTPAFSGRMWPGSHPPGASGPQQRAAAAAPAGQSVSVKVVYPPQGATIAADDSNFIFGSVSPASARLIINGTPVRVHSGGGFLAWLPLPPRSAPTYEIIAVAGADTARLSHPVRLTAPGPVLASSGPLIVDSSSVWPRQPIMMKSDEMLRVSVRAPANAAVQLVYGTSRRNLFNSSAVPQPDIPGIQQRDSTFWSTLVPARTMNRGARLAVTRGRDTVLLQVAAVAIADSAGPLFGITGPGPAQLPDTDRVIIARPSQGGTYKWMLPPGAIVEITGREGDFTRVRLDAALEVWIPSADLTSLPAGFAPPRPAPSNSRLVAAPGWMDLIVPIGARTPYYVETFDDRIELQLYGVRANLDNIILPTSDSLVKSVTTVQESSDRARITLRMTRRPFGYLVLWQGGNMVLRVRRPPRVTPGATLRGLTIAVDAGHPPLGATGPTGLYEATATLQIARRLRTILESRGARVVMTRNNDEPLDLGMRSVIARRANAHVMVSIHLNALPDGINPFNAHGTSTYYFQEQSAPLARDVQLQMVRRLRLRDLGVMYNTFSVTRPTWMPTILCEGAFIMIPEQEAAIRTGEFQAQYATAVADGLQRFFASVGAAR